MVCTTCVSLPVIECVCVWKVVSDCWENFPLKFWLHADIVEWATLDNLKEIVQWNLHTSHTSLTYTHTSHTHCVYTHIIIQHSHTHCDTVTHSHTLCTHTLTHTHTCTWHSHSSVSTHSPYTHTHHIQLRPRSLVVYSWQHHCKTWSECVVTDWLLR